MRFTHRSIGIFLPIDTIELYCERWRVEKGFVVEEMAYLRPRAVESGCNVNCVGVDVGGWGKAETDDASASADA